MYSLVLLFGLAVGAVATWFFMRESVEGYKKEAERLEKERREEEEIAYGFDGFNEKMQKKVDKRKAEIVEAIKEGGSIQTQDISNMFEVSSRTALRYLSELEEEGKIKQTGKTGRNVRYELKKH